MQSIIESFNSFLNETLTDLHGLWMFRRKRTTSLAKKVLKFTIENPAINRQILQLENWSKLIETFSRYLAKHLAEKQLRILVQSLESKGGIDTDCILLPKDETLLKLTGLNQENTLFCKLLRWPELRSPASLKKLVYCNSHELCGNPYHYSKITVPGK